MLEKMKKDNKGFTLVELIVVIAILGILVAVLAPQYVKYVEKSRISTDKQMAETLLSEVNVAITDAGTDGTAITKGAITVTSEGASETGGGSIGASLTAIDANWANAKVTNKGGDPGKTYVITYTDKSAKGEWKS